MPDERSNYDKGVADGIVEQRLNEYGEHLRKINGSTADTARVLEAFREEFVELRLALQRLADEAVARDETVKTTAAALEKARLVLKDAAEQRWSPIQKILAVLGGLVALTVLWYFFQGR